MIVEKFQRTVQRYDLFRKKDRILIAYSGGADSTGLLHLLLDLRKKWSFDLSLGHFNHKLRQSAEEDELFVRQIARDYSLPVFVGTEDVRAYAKEEKSNIEEAGRILRYAFLRRMAGRIGGAKIATGHTMTDQAETFLMRLMRGSGLRGLAAIFPVVEGNTVRPLIEIEREEIEAYLEKKGMKFCMDESNFDMRFLRNRIRHKLLPYIQENFEPQIIPSLARVASIIREEDQLLEQLTQETVRGAFSRKNQPVSLDLNTLYSFPLALQRRAVRSFISELRGGLKGISFEDIESILSLCEGKELPLKKDFTLRREQDQISLKKKSISPVEYEYYWKGEGPLEIKEVAMKCAGIILRKGDSLRPDFDDKTRVYLDLAKLKFPLLVRNRREGDRYRPLGSPGQKKLKEIMRAKDVPLSERGRLPVFVSGNDIFWIPGLPVSEKFKVTEETEDVFMISVSL